MDVSEKQAQLIEDLSFIEDRQERLAAVVDRGRKRPAFPEAAKTDANRVVGCISQVWIIGEKNADGGIHFQFEADSPLVKGLVALLIDLYEGGTPEDIYSTDPVIFQELGIERDLTPTRQNGLRAVREQIKTISEGLLSG